MQQNRKAFYELNKKHIKSTYFTLLILLAFAFIALLLYTYFYQETLISLKWLILGLLLIVVFPALGIAEHNYVWSRKNRYQNDLLQMHPYNELHKIGFENETVLKNYKNYKNYIKYAKINDIQVLFEVNKRNVAEFIILCDTTKLSTRELLEKVKEFKKEKIFIDSYRVKREINHNKEKHSLEEITTILNNLTEKVKMNNFPLLNLTEEGEY